MNRIKHAFTLIELLIVVAIIAILAAIAVPNFLEAQVRSKVSRAQSDMRSLATAIEAYSVDHGGTYPMSRFVRMDSYDSNNAYVGVRNTGINGNANSDLINQGFTLAFSGAWMKDQSAANRCTFGKMLNSHTLTTPTAYITKVPPDPFANTRGLVFGYVNMNNKAWLLWSYGPDCDELFDESTYKGGGQIGAGNNPDGTGPVVRIAFNLPAYYSVVNNTYSWADPGRGSTGTGGTVGVPNNPVYSPTTSGPTATLLTGGYTYDTTNGSKSWGDIWRCKQ